MKSIKKKLSSSHKSLTQETPLISSSPENPTYVSQRSQRTSSAGSSGGEHQHGTNEINSNFSSTTSVFRPSSPTSPGWDVQFHKPGKQDQSWVKDAREQSAKEPIIDPADAAFGLVTITLDESWISGIWQSVVLMLIFVVLPSVLFAITGLLFLRCAIIPNLGRSLSEKRKLRHFVLALVAGIVLSLVKDSIIAITVVYSLYEVSASIYEILYAIILFFSLLLFVIVPVMIFVFSGAQFSYGTEGNETTKKAPGKAKKLAENFMKENFNSVHTVSSLKSILGFIAASVPRWAFLFMIILAVILSVLRSFTPLLLMTIRANNAERNIVNITTYNFTQNATFYNATLHGNNTEVVNNVVMVLSALNAFTMSLSLSCVFSVAVLWQIIMADNWKSFSSALEDKCELVSAGSEGIVAWWRVYQTARFLTWSRGTPAGYLRVFIQAYFMAAIALLSVILFAAGSTAEETQETSLCLIIIDNLLMVAGLGVMWIISLVVSNRQGSLLQHLSLIRLNMTQDLGKYSAGVQGEQDRTEGEFQTHLKKFKGRNLRASLQALQEMIPVAKDLESSSMFLINIILTLIILAIGVISSALSIRKLL